MRKIALQLLVLIALGSAASAGDWRQFPLKGQYAFTGESACLVSPSGFNSDLTPMGSSFVQWFSAQGIRTFNGDGTGKVQGTSIDVTMDSPSSASSNQFSYAFTYSVAADGTLSTQLVPGSYKAKVLTGPRTGQTHTVDKLPLSGQISLGRISLTLTSVAPTVETVTFSNGNVHPRICHRSRTLILTDD